MAESDKLALYRLWRPQTFSDVVAQEQIVYPLRQSVINGNFSHAILFSGTRGTGKTSLAKIFSKAINCLNPDHGDPCNTCDICKAANDGSLMDISEIDAASHNSVDHMRRLTDEVVFTPLRARFKVYIIDEVHMLSTGAFNALLKTLEEPPSHAVFVMATTEPHRIPATIISRCQHFKFRRIPNEEIIGRIDQIAKSVQLDIDAGALEMIAILSGGALRDAISLLDQTRQLTKSPITRDDVLTLAGLVPDRFLSETAEAILFQRPEVLLVNVQELVMSGRDLTRFVTDLGAYFRNLLVASVSHTPEKLIQLRGEDIQHMASIAKQTRTITLIDLIAGLAQLLVSMRLSPDLRTTLEIGLIDLMNRFGAGSVESALSGATIARQGGSAMSDSLNGKKLEKTIHTDDKPIEEIPVASESIEDSLHDNNLAIDSPADGFMIGRPEEQNTHGQGDHLEDSLVDERPPLSAEPEMMEQCEEPPLEEIIASETVDSDSQSDLNDVSSSEIIQTAHGDKRVLDVWREVLDDLQKECRMDIALCARPARVCMNGDTFEIRFDPNLKGQHSCLSEADNSQLIHKILSNRIGRKADWTVVLDTEQAQPGETAEWAWLKNAREKALIEEIPSPSEDEN